MKTADIDSGAHSRSTSVVECVKAKLCTTILLAMLGLTSAVVSATEITDPIVPDIYQLTEAEKQAYLVPLIASDSGFLFDTGSADPSMYYNAGAYASTTVMGWVGMSTPATYAVYYGLEWVGFLISEILERTGDHRAAQYFPHSNKFDIDLSCDTAQSSGNFLVDAQNNFTTSFCDGDSGIVVLEVIADASASIGYSTYESMYNSLTLMSSTMLYTNSLLDPNNLEGTVNNVLNTLGMPNGGTSGSVPPYYFYTGVGPESAYLYVANRSHSSISASITQKMFSFGPTIYLDFPNIETGFTSDIIQQGTIAWAGGGDDTIIDVITAFGGAGNDTILGSTTANGENGNDILVGNRQSGTGYNSVFVVKMMGNCSGSGSVIADSIFATGIEEPIKQAVQVFPNPSNGTINITNNSNDDATCQIYTISGSLIRSFKLNGAGIHTLETKLDTGIYLLTYRSTDITSSTKLLIE